MSPTFTRLAWLARVNACSASGCSTLLLAASAALAIACTGFDKPAAPEPEADPPAPTAAPSVAAAEPAVATPAAQASPLHLVALREGSIQLVRLGATPALVLEGEPGKGVCRWPAIVLGPASLLDTRPGLVDALRQAVATVELTGARIYVGRLDGKEVLVAGIAAQSLVEREAFRRAAAKATGIMPTLECRIAQLDRMLADE